MKLSIIGFLIITFVVHLIPQTAVFVIVWALNEFAGTSIAYWIPAVILLSLWALLMFGYLLLAGGAYKKIKAEEEEFDRKFESMRRRM